MIACKSYNQLMYTKRFLLSVVLLTLFICVMNTPSPAQETDNNGQSYSTVEERRLHVRIIEEHDQITKDKKTLLLKEKELEKLREEIDLKLEELDRKLEELARQKSSLRKIQAGVTDSDDSQIGNLSRVYENMDPVKAATTLASLEPELAAQILVGMKSRSSAKILDILNSSQAAKITEILSGLSR